MPIQLVCRACRRPLTAHLCWTDETNHVVGQDREPSVPAGLAVRLSNESASSIHGPDGQIVGVHVFSPAGAIATHPDDVPPEALRAKDVKTVLPPLHGALLKNEQDVHLFERLVFMARQSR